MKKNSIIAYWGALFFMTCSIASCFDDKDWGGKMDEVTTIASIDIEETDYDAGDNMIYMLKNKELQLSYKINPENVSNPGVSWTSSDESVATVTQDGKIVTKDKIGKAVIRVTPEIGFGVSAATPARTIQVLEAFTYIESLSIEAPEEIDGGEEVQLKVNATPADATFQRYKWESSNPEVASVDKNGLVTGLSKGTATITVTADDMNPDAPAVASVDISVKVIVPITGIELINDGELSALGYGEDYQINYKLTPQEATATLLSWSSDNEGIVSVDKTGKLHVRAVESGTATITASYGNISQSITVNVAAGRMCYSFASSLLPWYLDDGCSVSYVDGKAIIKMKQDGNYRGDLKFAQWNDSKYVWIDPGKYRYMAIKMVRPSVNDSRQGNVKLDTSNGAYLGAVGGNNNSYSILGGVEPGTGKTAVYYYDLQSNFERGTFALEDGTFGPTKLTILNIVVADVNPNSGAGDSYSVYWIRTFKTVEELQQFVDNENK